LKEESISRKSVELEEMDRRIIELERNIEALEIKKQGVERQFELSKK
jgi:hypothetical protein